MCSTLASSPWQPSLIGYEMKYIYCQTKTTVKRLLEAKQSGNSSYIHGQGSCGQCLLALKLRTVSSSSVIKTDNPMNSSGATGQTPLRPTTEGDPPTVLQVLSH